MANIPYGTYNVNLDVSNNNWANGALVYNAQGASYKGQSVTNFNTDTTNVGWSVTLSHGGSNNCPISFTGGQYSTNGVTGKGQMTGGTVSGGCIVNPAADTDDWTAQAASTMPEPEHKTHKAHGHSHGH
jgi:hypothetical protein